MDNKIKQLLAASRLRWLPEVRTIEWDGEGDSQGSVHISELTEAQVRASDLLQMALTHPWTWCNE